MSNNASITRVGPRAFVQNTQSAVAPLPLHTVPETNPQFPTLDLRYDPSSGVLWKFLAKHATAHYSHEVLNDLRGVQNALVDGEDFGFTGYVPGDVRFLVLNPASPAYSAWVETSACSANS